MPPASVVGSEADMLEHVHLGACRSDDEAGLAVPDLAPAPSLAAAPAESPADSLAAAPAGSHAGAPTPSQAPALDVAPSPSLEQPTPPSPRVATLEETTSPCQPGTSRGRFLPHLNSDSDYTAKMMALEDMNNLAMRGSPPSHPYTVEDDLKAIEFEVKRQMVRLQEQQGLRMMKSGIGYLFQGIEMLNAQYGKPLKLDGWARYATSELDQKDDCLRKLHRKYWKHHIEQPPELELLLGVLGSVATYHVKGVIGGA